MLKITIIKYFKINPCKRAVPPLIFVVFLLLSISVQAQFKSTAKADSIAQLTKPEFYKWKLGIGMNIVDDKGTRFYDVFNAQENWNMVPYPSRINLERHLEEDFSFGIVGTINKYKVGKNISGVNITSEMSYAALDAEFKFFLNTRENDYRWLDPYVLSGAGYSWIDSDGRPTFNMGFGINIWLTGEKIKKSDTKQAFYSKSNKKPDRKKWIDKHIGFNLQSIGKVSVDFIHFDNQIQHSFGLVMRI